MNRATASEQTTKQLSTILRPRLAISERRLLLVTADALLIGASMIGSLLVWEQLGGRSFDLALVQSQAYWLAPLAAGWLIWLALSDSYNLRLAVRSSAIVWRLLAGGLFITFLYLAV